MAPLPTGNSRVDEKLLSGDEYGTLPGTPATQEATDAKQKNRSQKNPKSVRPISPDGEEMQRQTHKQTIQHTPPPRKQSTTIVPPLSSGANIVTPKTGKNTTRNKSNNKTPKSNNKSIVKPSPGTDLQHRQAASAAAEAASHRRNRRPRKKLYWNQSVRVKVVHNISNYTPQEKLDSWYSADEYSMMEDECELTSVHMDQIAFERQSMIHEEGKKTKSFKRTLPAGFCSRGLESWTIEGEEMKEQQVAAVIDEVWQAQIDAWEFLGNNLNGEDEEKAIVSECWEFIRERSCAVSIKSQLRAQELATKDEQDVDSYLNSVRSLEQSRRRITKMLRGKNCSTRAISKSCRTLSTAKSSRTLSTVSSSGSRSVCGVDNLKSILKSPMPKRSYSGRTPSQSRIPLETGNSFRIRLPKIGDDSNSLRSKSLRSNLSTSLRSNKSRLSTSLRSNLSRSSRNNSVRSSLTRSNSCRSTSARSTSLRSQLSRSNSLRSTSLRSNQSAYSAVSSSSLLSNSSKKIRYKPKSKIKIPTSPVGSVCSALSNNFSSSNHTGISDEEDLSNRMMRSHMSMSIGSEGSSRRRMLRASGSMKPPL